MAEPHRLDARIGNSRIYGSFLEIAATSVRNSASDRRPFHSRHDAGILDRLLLPSAGVPGVRLIASTRRGIGKYGNAEDALARILKLQGAKALVTGGSEGIGKAIAAALRQEGADVVITGRRAEVLEAAAEEVGVGWTVADVGIEDDAIRTVRDFVEQHGRLDILVNNAGFGRFAPLVEMALDSGMAENLRRAAIMIVTGRWTSLPKCSTIFVVRRPARLANTIGA